MGSEKDEAPNYDVENGGEEIPYHEWVRLRRCPDCGEVRDPEGGCACGAAGDP